MTELETASESETPTDLPAHAPDDLEIVRIGSGADELGAQKCKSCTKDAVHLSLFCEEHQGSIAPVVKAPRVRRLDIVLIALIGLLLWMRPEVRTPVWHTVFADGQPGVWQTIRTFFGRVTGSKGTADPNGSSKDGGSGATSAADRNDAAAASGVSGSTDTTRRSADLAAVAPGLAHSASRGVCGNGIVEPGEQCDGAALGGATCTALGFSGDCGSEAGCVRASLACLGDCRFDYTGCTAASQAALQRFVDNRDGTATDRLTGLVWELKCTAADCQAQHDLVAKLPWRDAVTAWVDALNAARFGGHDDWRVPSLEELRTLLAAVPPCATPPCPAAALPRDGTAPGGYWSSTSFSLDRQRAWAISFGDGEAFTAAKDATLYVRAVRSGS